jgi:hypothetical protein
VPTASEVPAEVAPSALFAVTAIVPPVTVVVPVYVLPDEPSVSLPAPFLL